VERERRGDSVAPDDRTPLIVVTPSNSMEHTNGSGAYGATTLSEFPRGK
jgi:hypothetical protein